jgi:hypothetical protein
VSIKQVIENILVLTCTRTNTYADLRPSRVLCIAFAEVMKAVAPDQTWQVGDKPEPGAYSTDQGKLLGTSSV